MGEARRKKLARAEREETGAEMSKPALEDLNAAHVPTAAQLVEGHLRGVLQAHGGRIQPTLTLWQPYDGRVTCPMLWGDAMRYVAEQTWSNKAAVQQWLRTHLGRCRTCRKLVAVRCCAKPDLQRLEDVERELREREGMDASGRVMQASYYENEVS